jgi:hypothetical protein
MTDIILENTRMQQPLASPSPSIQRDAQEDCLRINVCQPWKSRIGSHQQKYVEENYYDIILQFQSVVLGPTGPTAKQDIKYKLPQLVQQVVI